MTIDEAIAHAREVASRKFDDRVHCIKCAEEHKQIAEWLEELKELREKAECARCVYNCGCTDELAYKIGYNKAIDDFSKWLFKHKIIDEVSMPEIIMDFNEVQLKAGGAE